MSPLNVFCLDLLISVLISSCLHYVLSFWIRIQIFTANSDQDTIVYNVLSSSIRARYIRIHPWTYHNHISMRMEIYGC